MNGRAKKFDVHIECVVAADDLRWPSEEELESETLGGNRGYAFADVEGWHEVAAFLQEEMEIIERLYISDDVEAAHEEWMDEDYELPALYGFDLGTNALSAALAAARCLPFYGCNAGAFGGDHNDSYPLVAFFCHREIFPYIVSAARAVNAGLQHNHVVGGVTLFGQDVETLMLMASSLYDLRSEIDAVQIGLTQAASQSGQGELF